MWYCTPHRGVSLCCREALKTINKYPTAPAISKQKVLHPKWHPYSLYSASLLTKASWPKVVQYVCNRVPFGMHSKPSFLYLLEKRLKGEEEQVYGELGLKCYVDTHKIALLAMSVLMQHWRITQVLVFGIGFMKLLIQCKLWANISLYGQFQRQVNLSLSFQNEAITFLIILKVQTLF